MSILPSPTHTEHQIGLPVQQNPAFPPEFIGILGDTGRETLKDWLKSQDAPQEVLDLVDNLTMLHLYTEQMIKDGGQVPWWDNSGIFQVVAEVTQAIVALGGVFHGPDGRSVKRL